MASLLSGLEVARQALQAQQYGLDVTQNNIANVNTSGYARQRVTFTPGEPLEQIGYQASEGVRVDSVQSARSSFLDYRVNQELSQQSQLDASSSALQQVESLFNENSNSGLQSSISNFFNSFSSLANTPEDASLRQQVLANGQAMGTQFKQTYEQLQSIQQSVDGQVADTVNQINTLSSSIAQLNVAVASSRGSDSNENSLRDQRQQLVDQLGGLVDISYCEDNAGNLTITTRQGALLVAGNTSNSWHTVKSPTSGNLLAVYSGNTDITSTIQSGTLGGLLDVRDSKVTSYLSSLDNMAAGIISQVNAQHAKGADLNGDPGGNFLVPFVQPAPGSNEGAARAISVAISDPDKIAAGEVGAGTGSNTNAKLLADIQNQPLLPGDSASLNQHYQNLIFTIGLDTQTAVDGLSTQNQVLTQLQNQRDSVSGVSLDDEAVNVLRYQKAYEANCQVISVLDTLTGDLMQMFGGSG